MVATEDSSTATVDFFSKIASPRLWFLGLVLGGRPVRTRWACHVVYPTYMSGIPSGYD
jgi:hypothetical protein